MIDAMKQALEALEKYCTPYADGTHPADETIASLRQAIQEEALRNVARLGQEIEQEPWVWQQAPIKTQWGDDMVVADLAIDKDHTVSVYCERDQTEKVEAMFRGTNT